MRPDELLPSLRLRLAKAKSGKIVIGADEIGEWPDGFFDAMKNGKLLTAATPTNSIECRGCEEYCFMPVNILAAEGGRQARAFISCDRSVATGYVLVDFARLAQWQLTDAAFETFQNTFALPESANGTAMQKIRKYKAPLAFRTSLQDLLDEIRKRAKASNIAFDASSMPGRKLDFQELANRYDPELRHTLRTFDDYLEGFCTFRRGARETDFYRKLFRELLK